MPVGGTADALPVVERAEMIGISGIGKEMPDALAANAAAGRRGALRYSRCLLVGIRIREAGSMSRGASNAQSFGRLQG